MSVKKIKLGIISENKLVELFGTKKQIETYKKNGRFVSSNKNTILRHARQYCDVDDFGDGKYKISKVKEIPMTKSYENIHSGIYQYICPLMLQRLVSTKKPLTFTIGHWAREINMVNDNYSVVKKNSDIVEAKVVTLNDTPKDLLMNFYSHSDSMIYNYISQSLKYLQGLGLIIWREVYMVTTKRIVKSTITHGEADITIVTETHQASEEEMDYYAKCIGEADRQCNITEDCINKRYYSKDSYRWSRILQSELEKKHINQVYKAYEMFSTNYGKCQKVLNMYPDVLVKSFNGAFIKLLDDNAAIRYNKDPEKHENMMHEGDLFLDCYDNLAKFVIEEDVESCKYIFDKGENK